ncbi:MAG TPA: aldo/keto reductase [Pirellulales bacterium]|jgi:predicted aldo/keto reductase-like oxidoreductase|nr:aldo/keto reductase [Pirellulales bacterium]
MQRRTVLKGISMAAAGSGPLLGFFESLTAAEAAAAEVAFTESTASAVAAIAQHRPPETTRGDMRYRKLGRTGEEVSLIGVGGYHIGSVKDESEATKIIRTAIDRGVNFMDNCWDYHDGDSERRMGNALKDGYREKVFLMTKFDGRTKKAAAQQLDESLKRLQTDRVDLLQFHENIRLEDPDRFFADGGAREALEAAKQAGKIRYIGFTGHKDPAVHLRMLEVAQEHDFHFDTAQMPINVMDAHFRSFLLQVVPQLMAQEIALLGMKPIASGEIMQTGTVSATECLHYAMSMPTSVVITGIDSMKILDQALDAVKTFKPLDEAALQALLARTADVAKHGRYERFKTDNPFDSTAKNPQWLG